MYKPDMKRKILLIDDYADIPAALSAALSSEGYEVITAKNGREACERLREEHVDLAVLDLKIPVRDGLDAFERLKATHPHLQIIVITAGGQINTHRPLLLVLLPSWISLWICHHFCERSMTYSSNR